MLAEWSDFCVAQVGASAALLGLLFVGSSINLGRILALAGLPDRALLALVLIYVLVTATLMLVPGQPLRLLGAEVLIAGTLVWGVGTRTPVPGVSRQPGPEPGRHHRQPFASRVRGAAFRSCRGGIAPRLSHRALRGGRAGILASFIKAVADAWVLLIEINR